MPERANEVDWSGLFHAFGQAVDTPGHLEALLGEDARAFVDGYSHLWSTTLRREGKAWPATAPTALLVCDLLDNPLLGPDDPSLRDAMLAYLHTVAVIADLDGQAAEIRNRVQRAGPDLQRWTADYLSADTDGRARMWADNGGLGDLVLDQATLACFDTVPEILSRVLPHLASGNGRHRACAAAAVGALARHPSAAAQRPSLLEQLVSMAGTAESSYDLATIVIAIGQLGGNTEQWLGDRHPGVRGCAALASTLAGDEAAARVLLDLARSPHAFAVSFGDMAPPLHFQAAPYSSRLTQALLERIGDPAILAPWVAASPGSAAK